MLLPSSFSEIVHRITFWILLALFGSSFIRFMLMIDSNKRVYNHTPGPCRTVHNLPNGSASMEFVKEEDVIFITYGLANAYNNSVPSGIAIFRILNENTKYEVEKLQILGTDFDKNKFAPYGLSAYHSKGKTTLYVVNSLTQCIEIFQYLKEKRTLQHRKTVCSPLFTSIQDIVALGADRLIISNLAYFSSGKLQTVELAFQSTFGSLLYYDGKAVSVMQSSLPSPLPLAIDRKRNLLFVGSLMNEVIKVYAIAKDFSLDLKTEVALLASPSGIYVDEQTGEMWATTFPIMHQLFLHMQHVDKTNVLSPSQVLRIRLQEDGVSWIITEPFANDGATISASSSVVYDKKQLLIGSLFGRLLHCDINNPDIT